MKKFLAAAMLSLTIANAAVAADKPTTPTYGFASVAHLSCREMWQRAGQSIDRAFAMIETLTVYLLRQREQSFPPSREAGQSYGKAIDTHCRADPDQLLLAAIDAALRETVAR